MSSKNNRRFQHRSDERLGAILEAAERRREEEWKAKGRTTTLFVGIPVAALILWAVVFLIQYRVANPPVVETKPDVAAASMVPAEDQKGMEQLDSFLPNSQRVEKKTDLEIPGGQILDKEDIDFAMRLLNFSHADKPASKKP